MITLGVRPRTPLRSKDLRNGPIDRVIRMRNSAGTFGKLEKDVVAHSCPSRDSMCHRRDTYDVGQRPDPIAAAEVGTHSTNPDDFTNTLLKAYPARSIEARFLPAGGLRKSTGRCAKAPSGALDEPFVIHDVKLEEGAENFQLQFIGNDEAKIVQRPDFGLHWRGKDGRNCGSKGRRQWSELGGNLTTSIGLRYRSIGQRRESVDIGVGNGMFRARC